MMVPTTISRRPWRVRGELSIEGRGEGQWGRRVANHGMTNDAMPNDQGMTRFK